MSSNIRRAEQLGMPFGTAQNKLRKSLMFKFAQELGYDICYACNEVIENIDELSIEHKEPWEGRENGEEKFWDLDNIAFSHRNCNKPHKRVNGGGGIHKRKVGPDDTAWCYGHKAYLPLSSFHASNTRWNGVQNLCKECRK